MRIAYCPNVNIPTRAAEAVHTVKQTQWFSEIGHDVTLMVPDIPDPEAGKDPYAYYGVEETFRIVRLPWLGVPGKRVFAAYLAARRAKREGVDLVYTRSSYVAWCAVRQGLDTVEEEHTPVEAAGATPAFAFRRAIRSDRFRRLVVISQALKAHFREEYGLPEETVMVAPEAADDVGSVEPVPLDGNRFKVGYVGSLFPGKGMEVIGELSRRCPWAEFHCVGGTDEDIRRWRSELGGRDNVVFHGFVPHHETARYRAAFDVLVAPYQRRVSGYGGDTTNLADWMSPMKLFEYMSSAKPIVASDLPVLREVLEDERTALLCDPDRIDDWARALERLRQDPELRRRLGGTAREAFLRNHTWENRSRKVLDGLDGSQA